MQYQVVRGRHVCPENPHRPNDHPLYKEGQWTLNMENGVWGIKIKFCPHCGVKLPDNFEGIPVKERD